MSGRSAGAAEWDARLSVPGSPVCAPDWLMLREGADAAARSSELVERLRSHLEITVPAGDEAIITDFGCGTGSMGRWLAGRLPGPQLWVLRDRDPVLLARAAADMPRGAADGAPVRVRTRQGDFTDLRAAELAGTSLVTTSAVLDLLTSEELDALAATCVEAGCPALLTLTVMGRVEFAPSDPLDAEFAAAFDAHQRRSEGGRRLLGPDAGQAAVDAFEKRGATVASRLSPWRLGAGRAGGAALLEEWLRGWISAACEQERSLVQHAAAYLRRRLDSCASGELSVEVGHVDVLAIPSGRS